MSPNDTQPTLDECVHGGGWCTLHPGSVIAYKYLEAGNTLVFGAKVEGLQLAGTPL